ncbi:MAG: HAD family acid phosphatase [Kiloniellales bacterium]|nr:HAD family acid phosphatase [Kiloniellales bacterium]
MRRAIKTIGLTLVAAAAVQVALPEGAAAFEPKAHNDLLNATLWTQSSVEFKANSLAIYRLAGIMLDEALADTSLTAAPAEQGSGFGDKPPAVILDVDETVLDNSAYQAWLAKTGESAALKTWVSFVRSETSRPIPGSLEFIERAVSKGVKVFYVTNRRAPQEQATRNNLKALGYPVDETEDTVLTRGESEAWKSFEKSPRRAHIAETYRVVMMIGDNFGDFVDGYKGSPAARQALLTEHRDMWGSLWFVIANPMYGSWESAPFDHDRTLPGAQRRQAKYDAMTIWAGP